MEDPQSIGASLPVSQAVVQADGRMRRRAMFPGDGAAVPVQEPGSDDDAVHNTDANESGQDDSDSEGELMTLSHAMMGAGCPMHHEKG